MLAAVATLAALAGGGAGAAFAAVPPNGTLSDGGGVTYTGGPYYTPNASAQANGTPICNAALACDQFGLFVSLSAPVAAANKIKIAIQWPLTTADYDLYVFDSTNTLVGQSATSNDPETVILPAVNGSYTVLVAPFDPAGQTFTGTISLVPIPTAPPPPPGIAPRYQAYPAPAGIAETSGEPSISIDWNPNNPALRHGTVNTGGVDFFTANFNQLRVSFDDCSSPAHSLWEDVTSPTEGVTTLDPIGFADHSTGRSYQCQLSGGQSRIAFSDDDGATWTQGQGGPADQGPDHETLGGGPFAAGAPPHPLYPRAVYYCSQNVAGGAECGLSLDGGMTYLPGVDIFTVTQCTGGIHGHVKVAPDDGTVYVPNSSCATGGGTQGVAVSRDNGVTWNDFTVPGSSGGGDPSVGIGANGTVYLGWQNGDGHPHVAVSHDHGMTWVNNTDAGAALGIQNSVFPVVVAGDDDRAAFGFLGTPTGGNYQDTNNFHGIWHFYVATTYDGGASWYLVDATPDDPVQVGSICTAGTTCGADRNMLDFNDITIDREGRVVASFADGCVAPGCNAGSPSSSSRSAKGTLLRQAGGRRLLHVFDPPEPALPPAPLVDAAVRQADGTVVVSWEVPDDSGTPLTAYRIYRGTTSGGETLLATIGPGKPAYTDFTAAPGTPYFYRVTAVNAQGEGRFCGEVAATAGAVQSPCVLPGITVITDPSGDQTGAPANSELDILSVSLAEPWLNSCSNQLVFTMKVNDLSVVPPQARWTIFFSRANGTEYFVAMTSNDTGNPTGVSFIYGHTTVGTGGVRQLTTDGNADTGSGFTSDGTITIVLSLSKLTFNVNPPPATLPPPAPGDTFGNINAITQQTVGVLLLTIDSTGSNSYTLAGNRSCEPSAPPIAQLLATPNNGPAPLTVTFDGSGSTEPDLCDTVASYRFDFGDGSAPVTQAAPTIQHTYVLDGEFPARLAVTDSRGTASANTAQQLVTVEGGSPLCGGAGGFCFYTVAPCRVFDSRTGNPLASGVQQTVQVGGTCGVPMSARAVATNVTVVGPTDAGFLSVYPDASSSPPATSSLNFTAGRVLANNVVSGLSTGGQGTLEVFPSLANQGQAHVVIDVNGYFQ
ncbi:MAG: PKD domain-containing protein [Acidobacteria bacterium]|nr:PKD domain-containing protein [Acidobacteriota bacterium]